MPTIRVLPPNTIGIDTMTVNGRTYSASAGVPIDVPDFDAQVLKANGWYISAAGGVGATPARPASPTKGTRFLDTTLGLEIAFDGKVWRNATTGAVA
jgi:hypothetical protein